MVMQNCLTLLFFFITLLNNHLLHNCYLTLFLYFLSLIYYLVPLTANLLQTNM